MSCDWRISQTLNTWTDAECRMKVVNRRKVAAAIRSLVNDSGQQLECSRVLNETLLVPVLIYGSETIKWNEKMSRTRAVQMDNLRGLLGIRIMDKVPNPRIR